MIKETVRSIFSEIDFIRLYCAINFKYGCSPIVIHHELEKRLYEFKNNQEFRDLFQDIGARRDSLNPENSYLDLGVALNTAQLFGLLTLIQDTGEARSIISCDEDIAEEIIASTDPEMVSKMTNLFGITFGIEEKQKSEGPTLAKKSTQTMR